MNSSKTLSRWMLMVTTIVVFALSSALVSNFVFGKPIQHKSAVLDAATVHKPAAAKPQKITVGLPIRLKIPTINVDAALEYVNLAVGGELGVPKDPASAAWYDRGPRPGQPGSAVIDGHYGYKDNLPAVFDSLHKMQVGDSLYVQDDHGATTTFVVREVQTLGQDDSASAVFHSGDGKAHLNLITCEGTWNVAQKSYSGRLVVFADKVT